MYNLTKITEMTCLRVAQGEFSLYFMLENEFAPKKMVIPTKKLEMQIPTLLEKKKEKKLNNSGRLWYSIEKLGWFQFVICSS